MRTKSLNSAWWKIGLALLAIVPCLFVFTACGGETIEKDEAILASTTAAEAIATTQNFTIERISRTSMTTSVSKMSMNSTEKISVNNGVVALDVNGSASGSGGAGGLNITMTYNVNNSVILANVDGTYYAIKKNTKEKDTISAIDLNDYLDISVIMEYFTPLTEESFETSENGSTPVVDLKKMGEGDYNLNLSLNDEITDPDTEEVTTLYSRVSQEIRDGKIAKVIFEYKTNSESEGEINYYIEYRVSYDSSEIAVPTAEELAEYKDASLTIEVPTPSL